jgi:hypothetical protein
MNYTIASTKEVHTGFSVDIDNNRRVTVVQKQEDKESLFKGKDYETAAEAHAAYMRIVECILTSTYSFEDRAAML